MDLNTAYAQSIKMCIKFLDHIGKLFSYLKSNYFEWEVACISISIVLKEIKINGMKGKRSVIVGKNSFVCSSYRKSQEGISSSTGTNSFHHCRICFFDNDHFDTIIYKNDSKKSVRKKRLSKKKKGRVPSSKKRVSRRKFRKRSV